MKNWQTPLIINSLILFTIIAFGFGCKSEENHEDVYVAIVGNSKLSKNDVERELKGLTYNVKFEKEFIKEWIETEILYQAALKDNLINNEDFNSIIEKTKRELASSLVIENYIQNNPFQVSEIELKDYYKSNKRNFELFEEAYVLNLASFKEEDKAIDFRKLAINLGWEEALSRVKNDSIIIEDEQKKIFQISQIQSIKIIRVLTELLLNEISPIIKTEQEKFIIVQPISKIEKNSAPEFEFISDQVEKIYRIQKQRELIRDFLGQLLSEQKVKIY